MCTWLPFNSSFCPASLPHVLIIFATISMLLEWIDLPCGGDGVLCTLHKHIKIYTNTLNIHKSNMYTHTHINVHTVNTSNTAKFTIFSLNATDISKFSSGNCIWDWYFSLTSSAIKWVPASHPDLPCCLLLSPLPHLTSSNLPELDST